MLPASSSYSRLTTHNYLKKSFAVAYETSFQKNKNALSFLFLFASYYA